MPRKSINKAPIAAAASKASSDADVVRHEPPLPLATWEQPAPTLDTATLTQLAQRLRAVFSQLIEQFPSRARSMGGMATWLGVSKSTAQRVYEGIDTNRSPIDALRRLPGPIALKAVVDAAKERLGVIDPVLHAAAAVEQFEQTIAATSRSRQAFVDLLSMGLGDANAALPTKAERRALYAAALKVCGESLNAKSTVSIIEPTGKPADKAASLQESVLVTLLGARRRTFARPVVASILAGWWSRENQAGVWTGDLRPAMPSKAASPSLEAHIVDRFCTGALRPVRLEGKDSRTALLIDFPDTPDRDNWLGPLDVSVRFISKGLSNPLTNPNSRISAAVRIHQPTQLLIHDIYVHQSIASRAMPTPGLFSFAATPGDVPGSGTSSDWFERLPDDTRVMVLGHGAAPQPAAECPRHYDLARYAIEAAQIDPTQFMGFRVLVEFPVWQGEYRINFPLSER
jgi:hypothetical protein